MKITAATLMFAATAVSDEPAPTRKYQAAGNVCIRTCSIIGAEVVSEEALLCDRKHILRGIQQKIDGRQVSCNIISLTPSGILEEGVNKEMSGNWRSRTIE